MKTKIKAETGVGLPTGQSSLTIYLRCTAPDVSEIRKRLAEAWAPRHCAIPTPVPRWDAIPSEGGLRAFGHQLDIPAGVPGLPCHAVHGCSKPGVREGEDDAQTRESHQWWFIHPGTKQRRHFCVLYGLANHICVAIHDRKNNRNKESHDLFKDE